jgi:hypothetical protein
MPPCGVEQMMSDAQDALLELPEDAVAPCGPGSARRRPCFLATMSTVI